MVNFNLMPTRLYARRIYLAAQTKRKAREYKRIDSRGSILFDTYFQSESLMILLRLWHCHFQYSTCLLILDLGNQWWKTSTKRKDTHIFFNLTFRYGHLNIPMCRYDMHCGLSKVSALFNSTWRRSWRSSHLFIAMIDMPIFSAASTQRVITVVSKELNARCNQTSVWICCGAVYCGYDSMSTLFAKKKCEGVKLLRLPSTKTSDSA
jgi:hypothetical protein